MHAGSGYEAPTLTEIVSAATLSSSHNITHFGGLADRNLYGASLMSLSPAYWRFRLLAVFGAGYAAAAGQVEGRHIAQSPILNRLEGLTQDHV